MRKVISIPRFILSFHSKAVIWNTAGTKHIIKIPNEFKSRNIDFIRYNHGKYVIEFHIKQSLKDTVTEHIKKSNGYSQGIYQTV